MTDADDREGAPLVAVMSYRVWESKYGSDPSVVGADFQINGHAFTVIGVTPPGFYGAKLAGWGMPDIWLPITSELVLATDVARPKRANENYLDLLGRVRPGVNPQALEAKLRVEFHDWLASHVADMEPGEKQLWQQQTLHLVPGGGGVAAMRDEYEEGLKLLLIAAGCVLLVACGNLANLMLARGLKSRAQISVRVALGASRLSADAQGAGGERAAGGDRRRIWNCRSVWRNTADFVFGLRDRRAEQLCSSEPDAVVAGAAVCAGCFDL